MTRPASKAKASPASAPSGQAETGARFLTLLPTLGGLGVLSATAGALVSGLGFLTLRAREGLLGLSPGLSYPKQEWLVTGFGALGSLLWGGLSVLVSGHPVLQKSAWALLALLVGLAFAARSPRRPLIFFGVLAVSFLLLFVGSSFFRTALAATSSSEVAAGEALGCHGRPSANLADQAAFETCSWLENDNPVNDARRDDLGGLLAWLVAACLTAVVAYARAPLAGRKLSRLRWLLVGAHALLALLLLGDLPRAHAFGAWGWRYPQVRIRETCDAALAKATADGSCRAFDVSAGATKKVVFLRGAGCPGDRDGFLPLGAAGTDGGECLVTLSSPPRVIVHGSDPY